MATTYTLNMTVLSNSSQTYLVARGGMAAWCANGTSADPTPQFCRPADAASENSLALATEEGRCRLTPGSPRV